MKDYKLSEIKAILIVNIILLVAMLICCCFWITCIVTNLGVWWGNLTHIIFDIIMIVINAISLIRTFEDYIKKLHKQIDEEEQDDE